MTDIRLGGLADIAGQYNQGYEHGRARQQRSNLEQLMGDYYTKGSSPELLAGVARNGGNAQALQQNDQKNIAQQVEDVARYGQMFLLLPDEQKAAAYPQFAQMVTAMKMPHPPIPMEYNPSFLPGMSKFISAMSGQSGDAMRPMNIAPGGEVYDPTTNQVLHANQNFRPTYDPQRGGFADPVNGFQQVAPARPDYEAQRLALAQQAAARADQAAQDASEARRRAAMGNAPAGQRFRDDGTLEAIPGYAPAPGAGDSKPNDAAAAMAQDAINYAAAMLGKSPQDVGKMTPEAIRKAINDASGMTGTRLTTGPVASRIGIPFTNLNMGTMANADLEAYANSAAGKKARLNNPTGPVSNADFEIGRKSVFSPEKPDSVNADLIYEALTWKKRNPHGAAPPAPAAPAAPPIPPNAPRARNKQGHEVAYVNGKWVSVP